MEIFDASAYSPHIPAVDLSDALSTGEWELDWRLRDYIIGAALAQDDAAFADFVSKIPSDIDLIVLEEPWFGPAVLRLRKDGHTSAPIIFNSYNVEYIAKANILRETDLDSKKYTQQIKAVERSLVRRAAVCTVVTENDADLYSKFGGSEIVIAPNGTIRRKMSHLKGVRYHGIDPNSEYALFVGSAHPPNVAGFRELILESLEALQSHQRIVVAGNVCDPLYQIVVGSERPRICRDRLSLVGQVSEFELSALIANASAILLPITYGGGSNLKTAEALVSGKVVVGTRQAFRGYEAYLDAPGVILADTLPDFKAAVRRALDATRSEPIVRSGVEELLWCSTLQPIASAAQRLLYGKGRGLAAA
ncbi:glycosyltransferase [Chelativorans sp. J32]|uniref:glycosyltransferase n=1 Tax=Chelativorans sp. J32 TaxID=935840 RepID=UPI0018DC9B5A|nr:glycosyltransferase [Chelativorans sp. J32]